MEIRYLLPKILRFYVFKMAANGGRHFETEIKTENYKPNLFLKRMHTHTHLITVILSYYANNNYRGLF